MAHHTIGSTWRAALLVLACAATSGNVAGQTHAYPTKPVRVVVGNAPGGGTDAVARLMGQRLTERWGQPVVIDNRGGGVGVIAMELAGRAAPDGHTVLLSNIQMTINMVLKKVPFDIRQAYVPVVELTTQPYVIAVNARLSVSSVKELIAHAKANPGALRFGSPGSGSPSHIGIELFNSMAGLDMLHVPYKGNGPAMIDLMSGQIHMVFGTVVSVAPQARAGKLKALAVTSLRRTPALPELPSVAESALPGYELSNTYGFYAPAGTPPKIVAAINRHSNDIIAAADFKARLAADGVGAAAPNTPADYRAAINGEVTRLQKFFATSGVALDRFR